VDSDPDLVKSKTVSYGSNWMLMALGDDSNDDDISSPCKKLNDYLESKCEKLREGLMEWWGVSVLAHYYTFPLTVPYISTNPFATPPSPTSRETISQSKGPQLLQSAHFQVVGSLGRTYTINLRQIHLRHSRLSRVHFGMGSLMLVTKQQLMWQKSGTLVVSLILKSHLSLYKITF
jgi:hypothetical protein